MYRIKVTSKRPGGDVTDTIDVFASSRHEARYLAVQEFVLLGYSVDDLTAV